MIANFFSKTKPVHVIFVGALFFVYFVSSIFVVEQPEFSFVTVFKKIGVFLLFIFILFFFQFINRKNYLSAQNSFVLLISVILIGTFPAVMEINNLFIAHLFLILSFRRVYSLRSSSSIKQKIFDSGMWIGIASLFYIWSAVFMVLVYAAIFIYKKQNIRNLIIPIVGFATTIFLAFTFSFLTDNMDAFYQKTIFVFSLSFNYYFAMNVLIPICVLVIFTILSIIMVSIKINSLANDLKQSWLLVVSHLFCALYLILLAPSKNGSELLFLLFPLGIILTNFVQLVSNKILKEIIIYGMMTLSLSVYIL